MLQINLKKLHPEAVIPTQAKSHDAGFDLYSLEPGILLPNERRLFKTGISLAIPPGYYGRIAPRSGLALKQGLDVMGGVCDSSYRGDIGVILLNTNGGDESNHIRIEKGQKIAQIIFEKCHNANFILVDKLEETERMGNGFGSTGV